MSRKLDVAIAEALGYEVYHYNDMMGNYMAKPGSYFGEMLLHYSTSGADMLELDKEMQARGHGLELIRYAFAEGKGIWVWEACYNDYYEWSGAGTEPLARALAAYKALTGKEWQE